LIGLLALAAPGSAFARLTLEIGRTQGAPAYPQTNGRQIARSPDGTWFVAYDGLSGGSRAVFIAVSRKPDPGLAGEFHPAIAVVGGAQAVLRVPAEDARLATLVVGPDDILHLVWQSSKPAAIWHTQCRLVRTDPAAQLRRPESWTAADGRTRGAERVDPGDSEAQLGDAAGGLDGSL